MCHDIAGVDNGRRSSILLLIYVTGFVFFFFGCSVIQEQGCILQYNKITFIFLNKMTEEEMVVITKLGSNFKGKHSIFINRHQPKL